MKLRKTPVRTVNVDWLCGTDGCAGTMVFNGYTQTCNPPNYSHTCTHCRRSEYTNQGRFPQVGYEELPGDPHVD